MTEQGRPKITPALARGEKPKKAKTHYRACEGCDLGAVEVNEQDEPVGPCWCHREEA